MQTYTARMQTRSSRPWTGALGSSRRPSAMRMQMAWQHPRQTPALCPPSMPCTFSPRPIVSVAAADGSDAGSANGSSDVWQQLKVLNAEAEKVAELLKAARADLRKNPNDDVLKEEVQDLKKKEAGLDERRKALEATLAGGATTGISNTVKKVLVVWPNEGDEAEEPQAPKQRIVGFTSDQELQAWLARNRFAGLMSLPDSGGNVPVNTLLVLRVRDLVAGKRYLADP